MRIVGGRHRGRRLLTPAGRALRPTADRVREALFNILAHGDERWGGAPAFTGAEVVDLFAGTGALGLEALSRGAAHATFVDNDRAALHLIRLNAARLGESERATILASDATRLEPAPRPPARLAFLDPPYRRGLAAAALTALWQGGWLARGAVVVVELAPAEPFTAPEGFRLIDERRYGTTRLVFVRGSPRES